VLDVTPCRGILDYDPSELVITAAAGTPLPELEKILAGHNQFLPFEPPCINENSTLGGVIASGLSGPRRPWTGPVRDYVLGVTCINGRGEILRFGGQVIKNVAGYDLSRLLTGSMGTLAVILDVSLKLLPKPACEVSLVEEMPMDKAFEFIQSWSLKPVPLSGACYFQGKLRIRLSGFEAAVLKTLRDMGLQQEENTDYWTQLRHQRLDFFQSQKSMWRISIPPLTRGVEDTGECLIDWGGALYWVKTNTAADELRQAVESVGVKG